MSDFDLKNYSLEHKNNLNKTENSVKKSCRVEYISLECIGLEHNNALFITLYKTPERGIVISVYEVYVDECLLYLLDPKALSCVLAKNSWREVSLFP